MTGRGAAFIEWPSIVMAYLLTILATSMWIHNARWLSVVYNAELLLILVAVLWCTQRLGWWYAEVSSMAAPAAFFAGIALGILGAWVTDLARAGWVGAGPHFWAWDVVVVTPAVEEIFFRGYLLSSIRQAFGPQAAVIASTLLFAVAHLASGPSTVVTACLFGAVLALLTLRTRSVSPAILAHSAFNATQVLIAALSH